MFRFNYPMPVETKMIKAKRHNLYRAASHLNYTILKPLLLPAPTQTRATSSQHTGIPRTDHSYAPILAVTLQSKSQAVILRR